MYSNNKTWMVYTILVVIIILITYMQVTLYIPFTNIVKTEKIVESNSKITITQSNSDKIIDVYSETMKVNVHNVFNDLKVSRNFFVFNSQMELPNYVMKLQYISSDKKEISFTITVFNNSTVNINGEIFTTSENIYDKIEKIITVGN
jgi:hypothetical protein